MISAQYITQYREAYALWINEIVYADIAGLSKTQKRIYVAGWNRYPERHVSLQTLYLSCS
ncbi:hypothetical protein MNV_410018 [Candidatus Methanoperedens nitroreducens]|uniref:Uncharacterized protein n=1 Tax=Candidatus Methanoperedens nitratireducens TaxID=1392998 RepID=A0A284VQP3_9EURY|nr:hypothetical protein MNV_410018 [Candidatus Methanoperedens nitroreducens]